MKKTNVFAKLGLAAMCAFGTVTPVMSMMAPIHANDGTNTIKFSEQAMDQDMTLKTDAYVFAEPKAGSKVYYEWKAGTKIHVSSVTDNGFYGVIITNPVYGGECEGFIDQARCTSNTNKTMVTFVEKGFLALRNAPEFKDSNIIGKLFNDCRVEIIGQPEGNYVMVRVVEVSGKTNQNLVGQTGYVDVRYLI